MGGETGIDIVEDMEMFQLKAVRGAGSVSALTEGADTQVADELEDGGVDSDDELKADVHDDIEMSDDEDGSAYLDTIDAELEAAYAHYSAIRQRNSAEDDDDLYRPIQPTGLVAPEGGGGSDGTKPAKRRTEQSSKEAIAALPNNELIAALPGAQANSAAALWFQQPLFTAVDVDDESEEEEDAGGSGGGLL
eukprot:SAG22_NODE_6220_length_884_cov_0.941401_2_plen_191_part_01